MIGKFILLFVLAGFLLPESSGISWPELRGKYAIPVDLLHLSGYYNQPKTEKEAREEKWTVPPETARNPLTTTYCRNSDPSVCISYDKKGNVATYELSIPKEIDRLKTGMDLTTKGFEVTERYGQEYYTTKVLFESLQDIENGGREPDGNVGSGLWLPINGEYIQIPLNETEIPVKAPKFKKQLCFKGMGLHYFYDITPGTKVEDYVPWFLLFDNQGNLHGFGMVTFGAKPKKSLLQTVGSFFKLPDFSRYWWEDVPTFVIEKIAPERPDWFKDYIRKYGTFSHHVYLKENPWSISCPK